MTNNFCSQNNKLGYHIFLFCSMLFTFCVIFLKGIKKNPLEQKILCAATNFKYCHITRFYKTGRCTFTDEAHYLISAVD